MTVLAQRSRGKVVISGNPYHIERLGVVSAFALHSLPRLTPYDYRKEGLPHTRRNSRSGTATAGDSGDCQVNWPYTNLAGAAWGCSKMSIKCWSIFVILLFLKLFGSVRVPRSSITDNYKQ